MQRNKCKLRSGSPVPDRVQPKCPEQAPPSGGCPPSSVGRCLQYELEQATDNTCKPMIPPFYETDSQRPRRASDDDCCPCCYQSLPQPPPPPPPKVEYCGVPCPPEEPKSAPKPQIIGLAIKCPEPPRYTGNGKGCPVRHATDGNMCSHQKPPEDLGAECLQVHILATQCNPAPLMHQACPPFHTDLPCKQELEKQCVDICQPSIQVCMQTPRQRAEESQQNCAQTFNQLYGQQSQICPLPCLQPRLPPCPPECTPGHECPENRAAKRPDPQNCCPPGMGSDCCGHRAEKPPPCPGAAAEGQDYSCGY